jgi:hypothetical protein
MGSCLSSTFSSDLTKLLISSWKFRAMSLIVIVSSLSSNTFSNSQKLRIMTRGDILCRFFVFTSAFVTSAIKVDTSYIVDIIHINIVYKLSRILCELKTNETMPMCIIRWYLLISIKYTLESVYKFCLDRNIKRNKSRQHQNKAFT